MTSRKKVIIDVASIFVIMGLGAYLEQKGLIPDEDDFINGFFDENPKIKKLWGEISQQAELIRDQYLEQYEKQENL